MRKIYILLLAAIISLPAFASDWTAIQSERPAPIGYRLIHSDQEQIVVQFSIDGFFTKYVETPKGKAAIISVPKMVSLAEKGAPDVPKYAVSAIIGDDVKMDVRVVASRFVDIPNMEIAPSKGDFSRKIDPATVPYTYGSMYQQDAFFPATNTELQEPYILRNFRGQAVTIMPFVYNPVSKTLRVYYDLTIQLFRNGTGGANQFTRSRMLTEDPEFEQVYANHFINFKQARQRYPVLQEQGKLLIISHGAYMEAMQPFVAWKKTIGRPTEMVNVSTIGSTPEAIKTFIQNYYNTNGLTHVLLVGDHQHVPSYNNTTAGGYSDNFYGYLAGNDSYNELFVGRFSAESADHVTNMVTKIITYERDLNQNATWLNTGIGVARNEGAGNGHNGGEADYVHMDYIRDTLLNFTYQTVYREYDGNVPGLPNTTAAQISSRINAGASIINYCNHGSQTGWSVAGYSTSHVEALNNTDRWPIVWAVACDNGRFTNGTCFAETWMRASKNGQPTGAIGTMMSWISQPWQPPMTGQDEMVTILAEGYQNNIKRTFGGTSINGSMKMIDLHGSSGRSTHDTWILFGDPTLTLRTAVPQPMNVQHMPAIFLGMSEFTVMADAEGAMVSLTIDGEIIGTGTITGGQATVSFPALNNVGTLKVAVFGFNKETYISEIDIIPASGPFVAYMSNMVNGVAGGQVHYGQDVQLGIQLKNLGVEPATNIVATLTTNSPHVTILDGTQEFGTLQPNEAVTIADAFSFAVSNSVPNNTPMQFTITMTSPDGNWSSQFNLNALAPAFSVGNFTITELQGNGNGRLDPGETALIRISYTNSGQSAAAQTTGTISFDSPFVIVNSGTHTVESVEAGATAMSEFNVTVTGAAPVGQAVGFNFDVASGAYTASKSFTTKVGLILEDFETGNFNAFPWTFAGNLPWTITLVNPYEGSFSAKSGGITHSQSTQMILQYTVSANDSISFFRKVSSESGYDFLRFYIDNVKVGEWAGNIPWGRVSFPVQAGNRTFKWEYMKDYIVSSGEDCAWIDYITFPPTPVTSSWAGLDATICAGETHQLEGTATHYNSLLWTTSGTGTFSDATILNPVYTPSEADIAAGSVVLTLSATGPNSTVQSNKTLNINPLAEANAGIEAAICHGAELEITDAVAANYSSLLWTTSGTGMFSDSTSLAPVYTPSVEDYAAGQVVLTLHAMGLGNCASASSQKTLAFHALPTATIAASGAVCQGTAATLTLELTGAAPWVIEMANGMGSHTVPASPWTLEVSPNETTTYLLLSLTDANSCAKEVNAEAQVVVNHVPAAPAAPTAPTEVDHAFVTSSNVGATGVATATDYVWKLEPAAAGTLTANGLNATVTWNSQFIGTATISVAGTNDCGQGAWSEAASVIVKSTIGLGEQNRPSLTIYPNPSNGNVNLTFGGFAQGNLRVRVINLVGEVVYTESVTLEGKHNLVQLKLGHLTAGLYFVQVENGTSTVSQRMNIQR
ncbi:MAG: T9SS type A sorting domain-containing protein [Bacteroidetes bacterium]|nr:T9SS type A sorting domain-containing protein [Bacteroidota bacterium]